MAQLVHQAVDHLLCQRPRTVRCADHLNQIFEDGRRAQETARAVARDPRELRVVADRGVELFEAVVESEDVAHVALDARERALTEATRGAHAQSAPVALSGDDDGRGFRQVEHADESRVVNPLEGQEVAPAVAVERALEVEARGGLDGKMHVVSRPRRNRAERNQANRFRRRIRRAGPSCSGRHSRVNKSCQLTVRCVIIRARFSRRAPQNSPGRIRLVREAPAHNPVHRELREGAGVHARVQATGLPRPARHERKASGRRLAARGG